MRDTTEGALDSLTWYNGLAPIVFSWHALEVKKDWKLIPWPDNYNAPEGTNQVWLAQLQAIWVVAVCLFGDYGTSPRYGWIEDVDDFRAWVLKITETWRGADEYDGPEEFRHFWELK